MKTTFSLALSLFTCLLFSGCLKDSITERYTYYVPQFGDKSTVRANIKSTAPEAMVSPGKMFVHGNYIYLNEKGKGIHIIDYNDASSPQNIAYIPIPGNVDISVKGNYLYADEYADLLTIDISDPLKARLVNTLNNAFPFVNSWTLDSSQIVVSWRRVDTVMGDKAITPSFPIFAVDDFPAASQSGYSNSISTGGSTASFAVVDDRLYTVTSGAINVFNISDAKAPSFTQTVYTNLGGIETVYPYQNHLFLGSSIGMTIYNIDDADNPQPTGTFGHVSACDPVISDGNTAYVTLRDGTNCNGFTNELDVLNTTNLNNPTMIKSYSFTNPRGLAKENDYLFICDGKDGLKILNASDNLNITLLHTVTGFEANDVILNNGLAIVTAADGLYFIDYSNMGNVNTTGSIRISK